MKLTEQRGGQELGSPGARRLGEVTSGPPCLELVMEKQCKSPCWEWTETSEDKGERKDKKLWEQKGGDPLSRMQRQ